MTIRPVTSVNLTNSYNQVNFSGRRKNLPDNSEPSRITVPHRLAVPLAATVLAMCPMANASAVQSEMSEFDSPAKIVMVESPNVSEGNETVVASKTFPSVKGPKFETITPKITLINTKGGSGFDKIVYSESVSEDGRHIMDLDYKISALNRANYTLFGDDGSKANTLTFYDIELINEKSFVKSAPMYSDITSEMKNYIENALKSVDNNADIKINTYDVGLRQTNMSLQNVPNGDILKDAQPFENFGSLEGSSSITTKNGTYTIGFYSKDNNPDDAELVTVKKEGYPELQVKGVYVNNAYFNKNDSNPQKLLYGSVYLLGKDNNGHRKHYFLIDDDLTAKLIAIFEQPAFKNALEYVDMRNKINNYSAVPFNKCILANLDDE